LSELLLPGNAELIEGLERIKNSFHPYTLDKLAIAGAAAAFADDGYLKETCSKVIATRKRTTVELEKLGFEVLPSSANFVFAKHGSIEAKVLFEGLRGRNIIVRYFDKPRISEYLRISVGTDFEMDSLVSALSELVGG
jgi:histidinol-phosphate aminotransferase